VGKGGLDRQITLAQRVICRVGQMWIILDIIGRVREFDFSCQARQFLARLFFGQLFDRYAFIHAASSSFNAAARASLVMLEPDNIRAISSSR